MASKCSLGLPMMWFWCMLSVLDLALLFHLLAGIPAAKRIELSRASEAFDELFFSKQSMRETVISFPAILT